jgi:uncharacterized MAPEG superfamily protein
MTIGLRFPLLTAMLTCLLWIPVVIGHVSARGFLRAGEQKPAPTSPLPTGIVRANRAHLNAVENLAPFAVVALVAQAIGVSTPLTRFRTMDDFCARLAHMPIHISGFGRFKARTVASSVAWAAFIVFAIVLLRLAT